MLSMIKKNILKQILSLNLTSSYFQVHPWVNYDQILQKCFIGRLVAADSAPTADNLFGKSSSPSKYNLLQSPTKQSNRIKESPISKRIELSSEEKLSIKNESISLEKSQSPSVVTKVTPLSTDLVVKNSVEESDNRIPVLPRFDWIQKLDTISVIFYTKAFSNPLLEILPPNKDKAINICLTYDDVIFEVSMY